MVNPQKNPLLGVFSNVHHTAPLDKIKNEHFVPAFKESIENGEEDIKRIVENPEEPTFENTIVALDTTGRL